MSLHHIRSRGRWQPSGRRRWQQRANFPPRLPNESVDSEALAKPLRAWLRGAYQRSTRSGAATAC